MLTASLIIALTSVYDGDTFRVDLPCSLPISCHNIPVRVRGIDTPELRAKCSEEKLRASQAKNVATKMLEASSKIELRNIKRGKYFRIIADVYIGGVSFSEKMLESGLARRYDGGSRDSWCEPVK